jgi:ammonium transporter, Amt family
MVRKKHVLATMAQCIVAVMLVSVLWMIAGYSLTFVGGGAVIGSLDRFFLAGMTLESVNDLADNIPESLFMIFQMTFAIITVALISGSVADRMKFSAFVCSRSCGCSSSMCRSRIGSGAAASSANGA